MKFFFFDYANKTLIEKTAKEAEAELGELFHCIDDGGFTGRSEGGLWICAAKTKTKLSSEVSDLLSEVSGLSFDFEQELEWDTDGAPDGEKADEFGRKLGRLKSQAEKLLDGRA